MPPDSRDDELSKCGLGVDRIEKYGCFIRAMGFRKIRISNLSGGKEVIELIGYANEGSDQQAQR